MENDKLRTRWRHLTILKTSNKSVWSNVFRYVKVCISWRWIQYIIHWDKTQMLKKFPSDKISGLKNTLFFYSRAPTHDSFFSFCDSYMSWSTRSVSLKLCPGFSIFDSVSFLLKFIFFLTKCVVSLTLKRHNYSQN